MERPVNLNLLAFKFPVTAIASITHRITGVALFLSFGCILIALDFASGSHEGYELVKNLVSTGIGKFVIAGIYGLFFYHAIAGLRHLVQDFGYWESLRAARISAWAVIILSLIEWLGMLVLLFLL